MAPEAPQVMPCFFFVRGGGHGNDLIVAGVERGRDPPDRPPFTGVVSALPREPRWYRAWELAGRCQAAVALVGPCDHEPRRLARAGRAQGPLGDAAELVVQLGVLPVHLGDTPARGGVSLA